MGMPGMWELVIIFLIVLLVFGAGKIPKLAKDIGSGIREFKKSVSGEDDSRSQKNDTTASSNNNSNDNSAKS
ncbi:MAG TPA: twin-arginine translocase TatA/TatE family subunit [Spirochaetota bacterium]|nr:twin-arginine translocase TatA/TatE family subunit [Spirochaetota bacterium]HOS40713.1 twin-arginine translocase TatA/TatE family subunit [Spirochaetota bacterium]HPU90012.1 twin-arginine translocase TatA/TatE family subunit [Spirochaetota bacterium]